MKKEDYEEPCCPLNMNPDVKPIPAGRVIEKLDSYLAKNDYDGAERHLKYWLAEAEHNGDARGKLTVLNEQIGLYRKMAREKEGLEAIEGALKQIGLTGMENTITHGTTLVNAATGYKAFGCTEAALTLYEAARTIYEKELDPSDSRVGALYNNMALTLAALGRYREAEALYYRAMDIMSKQENGELEIAVTWLNLADLVAAEEGLEAGDGKITEYLEKAERLMNTPTLPRNGYYAFYCEKCASVFGYYGWFVTEKELTDRARDIYERS